MVVPLANLGSSFASGDYGWSEAVLFGRAAEASASPEPSASSRTAAERAGVAPLAEGPSAVPEPLPRRLRLGELSGGAPGAGGLEFGDVGGSSLGLSVGSGSGLAAGASRPSRAPAGELSASASSSQPPETSSSSARSGSRGVKRFRVS